jgi:TolA-binding protein
MNSEKIPRQIPEKFSERVKESLQREAVPWDDLRERRVLGNIQTQLVAGETAISTAFTGGILRVGIMVFTAAVLLLGLGMVLGRFWFTTSPHTELTGREEVADADVSDVDRSGSVVEIRGLGTAVLSPMARITFEQETDNEVHVIQSTGGVDYAILLQQNRTLVIHARQVEVRVIGTAFRIDITEDSVAVHVRRGLVSVTSGERSMFLGAGEQFQSRSGSITRPEGLRDESTDRTEGKTPPSFHLKSGSPELKSTSGNQALSPGRSNEGQSVMTSEKDAIEDTIELPPQNPATSPSASGVDDLLSQVDGARKRGDFGTAAGLLQKVIASYPDDSNIPICYFTLGNVRFSSGQFKSAAAAYRKYLQVAPDGILSEDASAAIADALSREGDRDGAIRAARQYLDKYATGVHASRMRAFTE